MAADSQRGGGSGIGCLSRRCRRGTATTGLLVLSTALAGPLLPQSPSAGPPPVVRALRASGEIRLDGMPDEPAWQLADSVTDFRQQNPVEGAPASQRTVARILATDRGLIVAFWCYDREPSRIRRTQLRRDADTDPDDVVAVLLDPQLDRRSGYAFAVNPNGALVDLEVLSFEDQNADWNGVWDARARVTDFGWTVEMLLPWQMLRYPLHSRRWGINLGRIIRRNNEDTFWRGWLRQQGFFFQDAEAVLEVPDDLPPRRPFEGRPYLAGTAEADTRSFLDGGRDSITASGGGSAKLGFDGKLAVAPTLNLDVTLNTDFAQVEADQQVVNLTRFPVFFPEKRDFFLEASGTFAFGRSGTNQLFHSRRIGLDTSGAPIPIVAGARLTGRVGSERIGLLALRTGGGENAVDLVARVKHDVLSRGYVGAMVTSQSGPGVRGDRLAGGVDFNLPTVVGRGQNLQFSGFAMASRDSAGPSGSWYFVADFPNDFTDDFLSVMRVDSGFNPALGFVRQTGIWRLNTAWRFYPRPHRWGIRRFRLQPINAEVFWNERGGLDHATYVTSPLGAEFESGDFVALEFLHFDDVPADSFELFPGVSVPPGRYGWNRGQIEFSSAQKRPLRLALGLSVGGFYHGSAPSVSYEASLRVAPHVIAGLAGEVSRARLPFGDFTAQVHRLRLDYATNPRLNTTLFVQWNNERNRLAVNARLHWIPRPGTDAYLVWNTAWPTDVAGGVPWRRPLRGALVGKFVHYFRM